MVLKAGGSGMGKKVEKRQGWKEDHLAASPTDDNNKTLKPIIIPR